MDLTTALENMNWLSVLVAAISCFLIGGLWYGPLFGAAWMAEFNFTQEHLKKRNVPRTFGLSLFLAFLASMILEMFIGAEADFIYGAVAGFLASFGWVATFLGILYLFEMKSLKAYAINAGYCIVTLTIMGTILGAW
ncbi:MAG: DUF1761 domain-containing protein [Saonia sp.]